MTHQRAIFTPKYGNIGNFEFEDFLFPYLLRQQKLFDFCCEANNIYPELVRVFYFYMNFRKNLMTSHVKGKDIVLDIQNFSSICCDIPITSDITGFGLVCDWDEYDCKRFYLSICRIPKEEIERRKQQSLGETVKNRDILSAGYLSLEDRLNKIAKFTYSSHNLGNLVVASRNVGNRSGRGYMHAKKSKCITIKYEKGKIQELDERPKKIPNPSSVSDPFYADNLQTERLTKFLSRKPTYIRYANMTWLAEEGFRFSHELEAQGATKFLELKCCVYPSLIREFYANFQHNNEYRMLHYLIAYILVQRNTNHAQPT
ncbi:hypothetical protein Lal_00033575 [Lupinus albus]|nr:hypothetical protein Lal_00033575 [Lupinus albus]